MEKRREFEPDAVFARAQMAEELRFRREVDGLKSKLLHQIGPSNNGFVLTTVLQQAISELNKIPSRYKYKFDKNQVVYEDTGIEQPSNPIDEAHARWEDLERNFGRKADHDVRMTEEDIQLELESFRRAFERDLSEYNGLTGDEIGIFRLGGLIDEQRYVKIVDSYNTPGSKYKYVTRFTPTRLTVHLVENTTKAGL